MIKPWVAALSVLAGAAAIAVPLYIQVNPRAFTTATEPPRDESPPAVTRLEEVRIVGELPTQAIELQPVYIRGKRPGAAEGPPLATKPCSDWRDLGPKATSSMEGARQVRMLCM